MEYEQASVDTTMWNSFELQYPEDYPCQDAWQPLMDIIDFNGTTTDQYFAEHYNEWYYTSNLVDYWCLLVAFNIMDMPYKNTFLSTPDINFGHQYMLSPWDLDASLGRDYNGKVANYTAEFGRLNFYAPFNRLIAGNIDNFKGKIASRWAELTQTALSPANLESHINAIAQRFVESGAWQREYERWQGTRVAINANINSEINYVKGWYGRNYNYISTGMAFWREDINANTVTLMYNYLLGDDGTFYDFLDLNRDGAITATDIIIAYNIMLNQ
ncbi:MAG: CotH kinase family protein [Muribaculaceae bacterium]|nr:CotH kinase family protein [Muribaculaceae bacterium]